MHPTPPPFPAPSTPPAPALGRTPDRGRRLLAGGAIVVGAGALAALPLSAFAQDDGGWLSDTLQTLVDDGTLTADQADAVENAIDEARPERPGGPFGHGPIGSALDAAAEALGIERSALVDDLGDGQTIADIAAEQGVDVATVIDAIVADAEARIDEAIADGRLDAAEGAERKNEVRERVTELVEEGFPAGPRAFPGRGHGGPWMHMRIDCDDDESDGGAQSEDGSDTTATTEPTDTTDGS